MIYCAAITSRGAGIAKMLADSVGASLYLPENISYQYPDEAFTFSTTREFFDKAFKEASAMVCVMACGIVVRGIKDLLQSKSRDPAVVVVDEGANFAISLISGHLGGANELARRVAAILGAQPVITTATDVRGLPAFDDIARVLQLKISNMNHLKRVHMAMLEGEQVHVLDVAGILRRYWGDDVPYCVTVHDTRPKTPLGFDVVVTTDDLNSDPSDVVAQTSSTLFLAPRTAYFAGIGCNSGTTVEEILSALEMTFTTFGLDIRLMCGIATIDKKIEEPGLIEAARRLFSPITFFSKEELSRVYVPNPSDAPMRAVGSPSVAEASAILATRGRGGLVVEKQKIGNLTIAISSVHADAQ